MLCPVSRTCQAGASRNSTDCLQSHLAVVKLGAKPWQQALGAFGIAVRPNEDTRNITIDRDDALVLMPDGLFGVTA